MRTSNTSRRQRPPRPPFLLLPCVLLLGVPVKATQDEETRTAMLNEAAKRMKSNRTGNGKFFLSTGAWFLTDEYVTNAAKRGCPECVYRLDEKFSKCLAHI